MDINHNDIQKEQELQVLEYFCPIYEHLTGDLLEIVEYSERPDFICTRNDRELVGIEIVQVRSGDPGTKVLDMVLFRNSKMLPEKAIDIISSLIYEKELKRKSGDWKQKNNTMLILQLLESPLREIHTALNSDMFPDLPEYGFAEIWLADFTEIEEYDNIELFCLYPPRLEGYYKRPMKKPYS